MQHDDEQAIRDLIEQWARATAEGDLPDLLAMMSDDVVFLTPGQSPMGREDFAAGFMAAIEHVHIQAGSNIQEIGVHGDWAYCWNHLDVRVTPRAGGSARSRSGHTLTILHKEDGEWTIARDANLLGASL